MDYIFEGLRKALGLIIGMDRGFLLICWTSVWVSVASVALAGILALPAAFFIAMNEFRGKKVLTILLSTLMAFPTVVVGLLVYSFLCRRGLLGRLELLYTPYAMIIGQCILASPIICSLTVTSLTGADERIGKTAVTLGATGLQSIMMLASELRMTILAAMIAGFGRVFSEVGVSMMLGGNIKNYTRNITTAIAFETTKGEFSLGLALGMVLLAVAFIINLFFKSIVGRSHGAV